jgi:hypothetical protein
MSHPHDIAEILLKVALKHQKSKSNRYTDSDYSFGIFKLFVNIFFPLSKTSKTSISAISWGPVLVVEEAGVLGENHRPWASN